MDSRRIGKPRQSRSKKLLESAFSEVHTNIPSTVKATGKTGRPRNRCWPRWRFESPEEGREAAEAMTLHCSYDGCATTVSALTTPWRDQTTGGTSTGGCSVRGIRSVSAMGGPGGQTGGPVAALAVGSKP